MKTLPIVFLLSVFVAKLSAQKVSLEEVQNYMNRTVTVCGKVFNGVHLETAKGSPTMLNMGEIFPNHQLTILIWGENLKSFPDKPELYYANKQVCITGLVIEYRGKPEIVLKSASQIQMDSESTTNTSKALSNSTPAKVSQIVAPKMADKSISTDNEQHDDIRLSAAVSLRLTPSTGAPIIFVINKGSIVTLLSSSNGWSRISVKKPTNKEATVDKEGYVRNALLLGETLTADNPQTPASKASVETKPAVAPQKPASTNPPAATKPQTPVEPIAKTTETKLAKDEIRLSSTVDMRAGPGEIYKLISQVKAGTIVTVLFSSNGWSQVGINDSSGTLSLEGYINNGVLR